MMCKLLQLGCLGLILVLGCGKVAVKIDGPSEQPEPENLSDELELKKFKSLADFLPTKEERAGLDDYTRAALTVLDRWHAQNTDSFPTDIVVVEERNLDKGKKQLTIAFTATVLLKPEKVGNLLLVSLSAKDGSRDALVQLGVKSAQGVKPFADIEELKKGFANLESAQRVAFEGGSTLLDMLNLEADVASVELKPAPNEMEGKEAFLVTFRTIAHQVEFQNRGDRWVIVKIVDPS